MTKKEARAILTCVDRIHAAIEKCRPQLSLDNREWGDAYWIGHIRRAIDGHSYGSAPVEQAANVLEEQ